MINIWCSKHCSGCTQTCSFHDVYYMDMQVSTSSDECYMHRAISTQQTVEKSKEEKKIEASLEMRNAQVTKSYDRKHKMPIVSPKTRYKEHYRNCKR